MNAGSSEAGLVGPARSGVLDISGVTVRFGGLTALDDVSLSAAPRQVTGIIGPNGAGKTTLLNAMCGFVRPAAGSIAFDGHELTAIRPHRLAGLGIARTLQGVGLFRGLSVAENVMIGATPRGAGRVLDRPVRPAEVGPGRAAAAGAGDAGARPGGRRRPGRQHARHAGVRRCASGSRWPARWSRSRGCCCSTSRPAGCPRRSCRSSASLIKEFAAEASVVVIEHRMDLMMSVCDTIFVLDFGKLIADGHARAGPGGPGRDRGVPRGREGPRPRAGEDGPEAMTDAAVAGGRGHRGGLRRGAGARRRLGLGQARHDHRGARRQRRGQDHAAARDQRLRPAAAGGSWSAAPTWPAVIPRTSPGPGSPTCPRARE